VFVKQQRIPTEQPRVAHSKVGALNTAIMTGHYLTTLLLTERDARRDQSAAAAAVRPSET
jgi:hypothetical protein